MIQGKEVQSGELCKSGRGDAEVNRASELGPRYTHCEVRTTSDTTIGKSPRVSELGIKRGVPLTDHSSGNPMSNDFFSTCLPA